MLGNIGHNLVLSARAKTGVNGTMLVWVALAGICATAALIFLSIAAFAWVAQYYGAVNAGLAVGGFYLAVAVIAAVACAMVRHRTAQRARAELAAQRATSSASLFDPRLLAIGLQIGGAIGWKRLIPLAAVGLLAAGLVRENMHKSPPPEPAE